MSNNLKKKKKLITIIKTDKFGIYKSPQLRTILPQRKNCKRE